MTSVLFKVPVYVRINEVTHNVEQQDWKADLEAVVHKNLHGIVLSKIRSFHAIEILQRLVNYFLYQL